MEAVAILIAGLLIREGLMNIAGTFVAIAQMLRADLVCEEETQPKDKPI